MSEGQTRHRLPILDRAKELLADGEWHDYEELLSELGKLIPPGMAFRAAERSRRNSLKSRGLEVKPRTVEQPYERLVATGRRVILMDKLRPRYGFELDVPAKGGQHRHVGRRIRLRGEA